MTKVGASHGNITISIDEKKRLLVNGVEASLPYVNNNFDVHEATEEFLQVQHHDNDD